MFVFFGPATVYQIPCYDDRIGKRSLSQNVRHATASESRRVDAAISQLARRANVEIADVGEADDARSG